MALLEDSLIAHYRMNDNLATDVILDETGNHNGAVKDTGGTATSAFHSVAGKILNAQEFDGVDDYISIPDHADFSPVLTPFSISAWVNIDDALNFEFMSKGTLGSSLEWVFRTLSPNGRLNFFLYDENQNKIIGRQTSFSLSPDYENQWLHVIATYDGGILSAGIKLYLNGVRVDASNYETPGFISVIDSLAPVFIGRDSSTYANGTIDNVMFFSKALTALEVQLLYNSGAGVETIPTGIHLSRTGQQFSSNPMN